MGDNGAFVGHQLQSTKNWEVLLLDLFGVDLFGETTPNVARNG